MKAGFETHGNQIFYRQSGESSKIPACLFILVLVLVLDFGKLFEDEDEQESQWLVLHAGFKTPRTVGLRPGSARRLRLQSGDAFGTQMPQ
jgi:hypothetical protein